MISKNKTSQMMLLLLLCIGCSKINGDITNPTSPNLSTPTKNYYTQGTNNRVAAEWEPAKGVIIAWPLAIPHQLAIELANDSHLYTIVKDNNAQNQAQSWFNTWGISADKVTFITTEQGQWSWWTRDWGPSAVFNSDKQYFISNGKFVYGDPISGIDCNDKIEFELEIDTNGNIIPSTEEDNAPLAVANTLGASILDLPFINTGGNVATNGIGNAISTCILINENNYYGVNHENFMQMNKAMLGFEKYSIISNFEKYGIQHIDCFMKIINEETLLVAETPNDHPMRNVYENIVNNELSKLKTAYGRPYKILRIKTARYKNDDLAAYTNSLILNKTIYVPLFDIAQDAIALETWRNAMPGYTVKGFKYTIRNEPIVATQVSEQYGSYGWNYGDALHCRVRAVWDSKMLFTTTKKIDDIVSSNNANKVYTTLIDYSGNGLDTNNCKLFWRINEQSNWNEIILTQVKSGNINHFYANIPHNEAGTTVEYYIQAVSNSGKTETQPRTAPQGFYKFKIQ